MLMMEHSDGLPAAARISFSAQHSAPRGILFLYILHRLSLKPAHGYEILQDIKEKTGGAWRPGPGALYPMLKKMSVAGYITCIQGKGESEQKVYALTPKGEEILKSVKKKMRDSGNKMNSLRGIFLEMMGKEDALEFLVGAAKDHFEMIRAACSNHPDEKRRQSMIYALKEYLLHLEKEAIWVSQSIRDLENEKNKING